MAPKATAVRRLSAAIMITAILLPAGFGPVQAAPPVEREWIVSLEPGGDIGARAKALTKEVGRSPKHIYTNAITGSHSGGPSRPLPDSQPRQVFARSSDPTRSR